MYKILLIEDDKKISMQIREFLEKMDYKVAIANSFEDAIAKINESFDLALLDINLPDKEGTGLLRILKDNKIRVIITTVKNDENFIVKSLDNGADDYLTKPFNLSVLRARIDATLRTFPINSGNKIKYKNFILDIDNGTIYYKGKSVDLAALEFEVLSLFIKNPNRIFTRNQLLTMFWEDRNQFVNDNTLTATIKRIRDKTSISIITTIRGIGYRIE
ncbi:two component transcriptional regulator, winged helix family [Alkaliphilus oremlandii OhILAs]|uniref:Stage 0 sporulation protein A homolog n=1 Tax=Alkaliphilus oremlandii (strain OhILAs) TaxID=350688 RepID=A8MMB8_ALKOO|nr:response regulator transcription factor [Alkaliphilus oremlandii]ABW18285.1 two component transcriptional regulator, winged helix family [Alkaliphilus oremlandii OhILAs]